jgi:hypothetical protein
MNVAAPRYREPGRAAIRAERVAACALVLDAFENLTNA